jgi:hypothetical protein
LSLTPSPNSLPLSPKNESGGTIKDSSSGLNFENTSQLDGMSWRLEDDTNTAAILLPSYLSYHNTSCSILEKSQCFQKKNRLALGSRVVEKCRRQLCMFVCLL